MNSNHANQMHVAVQLTPEPVPPPLRLVDSHSDEGQRVSRVDMLDRVERPRRGLRVSLGNGLRHDHTVTCTVAGTPNGCSCPYTFWHPRAEPRKRVRVVGTEAEALRLREHMQREASGTIYMAQLTPYAPSAVPMMAAAPASGPVPVSRTPTLNEWAVQVMETVWMRHSDSTRQTRKSAYLNHVEPDLGSLDLAGVTPAVVEQWLGELRRRGVTHHMQRSAYDVLRVILNIWYEQAGVPNPIAVVKRPAAILSQEKRAKDCAINAKQYQNVIDCCANVGEELMIRVATEAGLRIGEIAGLQRRDVNIDERTITVKRQGNRNTTKTGRSRTITMVNDDLVAAFKHHFLDLDNAGFTTPDTYVWRGGHTYEETTNQPYTRGSIYKQIRRVLKRAGLDTVTRPHGLRATGAQLLIEAGASMALVSQHLGHAQIRTTESYYVGQIKTDELASYGEAFG